MAARVQWWKNGDHPKDESEPITLTDFGGRELARATSEGKVVGFYHSTHPDMLCPECQQAYAIHGDLDGEIVHPGDWIITHDGGAHSVEHPNPMARALDAITRTERV